MADFTALKTAIQNAIKQNGNEEITGNLLQDVLLAIVTTLGEGNINNLINSLDAEVTARQQAVSAEAQARQLGDSTLQEGINTAMQAINAINNAITNGCVYAGIATPSITPASGKVFYLAFTAGTYTNFNSLVVPQGINILKNNGSTWSLDSFLGIDDAPTPSSNNLVKSGGIFNGIMTNGSAFDLTAYNNGTTYADLNAAITALNALPAAYKKGGMSMKYVQSSDNMYRRFNLIADEFTTNVTKWQSVDEVYKTIIDHNLENKLSVVQGNLKGTDGSVEGSSYNVVTFDYFKVNANTKYQINYIIGEIADRFIKFRVCFYDSNFDFVSSTDYTTTNVFTSPSTAVYAKVGLSDYDGSLLPASYIRYISLEEIGISTIRNLNIADWVYGNINTSGVSTKSYSNMLSLCYFSCEGITGNILLNSMSSLKLRICAYDANLDLLSATGNYSHRTYYTIPNNAAFLRFGIESASPAVVNIGLPVSYTDDVPTKGSNADIMSGAVYKGLLSNIKEAPIQRSVAFQGNINGTTGAISESTTNVYSNIFRVRPNTTYFIGFKYYNTSLKQNNACVAYYDEGGNFISRSSFGTGYNYTTPSTAHYAIVCVGLINYQSETLSPSEIKEIFICEKGAVELNGRINADEFILGNLSTNGTIGNSSTNIVSPIFYSVKEGQTIILNCENNIKTRIVYYDSSLTKKSANGSYGEKGQITIPTGVSFIRIGAEASVGENIEVILPESVVNSIPTNDDILPDSQIYKNFSFENLYNSISKFVQSGNLSKNTFNTLKPIVEQGAVFGHEPQLIISNGIAYCAFLQNTTDSEDLWSATSKVVLAVFAISDYESASFSYEDITFYEIGKLGDLITESYTAKSCCWDPALCLIENTLHITCSYVTTQDSKGHIFHRTFNISTQVLSNWEECNLDSSPFSTTTINNVYEANHFPVVSGSDYVAEMVADFCLYNNEYYNAVILGKDGNNGIIVKTTDFINYTTVSIPPFNFNGNAEFALIVNETDNRLYVACRQYYNIPYLYLVYYNLSNDTWGTPVKLADGNVRPRFFKYDNKYYLYNTITHSSRTYSQISKITKAYSKPILIAEPEFVIKDCGWYNAFSIFSNTIYFISKKDKVYFGKMTLVYQDADECMERLLQLFE